MKTAAVFWHVAQKSRRRAACFITTAVMEAVSDSEMSVHFYQITGRNIQEDSYLQPEMSQRNTCSEEAV
jgi:hypothetical protein